VLRHVAVCAESHEVRECIVTLLAPSDHVMNLKVLQRPALPTPPPIPLMDRVVVAPDPTAEAAADIERAPEGSACVKVIPGSMRVIILEEPEAVFLRAGQEAYVSLAGNILPAAPPQQAPSAGPQVQRSIHPDCTWCRWWRRRCDCPGLGCATGRGPCCKPVRRVDTAGQHKSVNRWGAPRFRAA
jgi:hypothetical protein